MTISKQHGWSLNFEMLRFYKRSGKQIQIGSARSECFSFSSISIDIGKAMSLSCQDPIAHRRT